MYGGPGVNRRWIRLTAFVSVGLFGTFSIAGCGTANRTPQAIDLASPPAASAPDQTSSSLAPVAPAAGSSQVTANVAVTDNQRYTYAITFNVAIASNPAGDSASAKPGEVNVSWSPLSSGTFTLTNTTDGHTLPIPDVTSWPCGSWNRQPGRTMGTDCVSLYGFFPMSSPVCTVQTDSSSLDHGSSFAPAAGEFAGYVYPPGKWCVLNYGWASALSVPEIAAGGAASSTWQSNPVTAVLVNEKQYPVLAAALNAGPRVWAVLGPTSTGAATSYSISGCRNDAYTVFWSSKSMICARY